MAMIDQIKRVMKANDLSATQFADEIGIQRSSVSHVLSGRNKPSLDFMLKIKLRYPELNLDWLLLGDGEMFEKENEKTEKAEEEKRIESGFDLFAEEMSRKEEKAEKSENVVENEQNPVYKTQKKDSGKIPEKIIVLYTDKTFSIYTQKG